MARILVIDDEGEIRSLLRQVLERLGYEVEEAPDGKTGIDMYRKGSIDLIITDVVMPEKDGMEAIQELRGDFPHVKIIAVSGGARVGPYSYLMMAQRLGADRIFSKPIDRGELVAAVQELLG